MFGQGPEAFVCPLSASNRLREVGRESKKQPTRGKPISVGASIGQSRIGRATCGGALLEDWGRSGEQFVTEGGWKSDRLRGMRRAPHIVFVSQKPDFFALFPEF